MILYLDTSAWVKLYVAEVGALEVRDYVDQAEVVATSRVTYPEARAALARRQREGHLTAKQLLSIQRVLADDMRAMLIVELTASNAWMAGELAEQHCLRGFDAIHLSAARELWQASGETPHFCCFDARLSAAAQAAGLQSLP